MEGKSIEELEKEAKREYYRKWREEHKENVKRHNQTYWHKKAVELNEKRRKNKQGE